jgi:hypothetical protein
VAFRRAKGMLALPCPIPGDLTEIMRLLNVEDADWVLCAAWLVGALRASGPYPILALHGEQGSAKTVCTKMLRQLLDPSALMVRSMFREERDLAIAASNTLILAWDNISKLADWQSDALCRVATGSGFATRKLHSDDEEVLFESARPMILNGIEHLAERADLADRTIMLELPIIPESKRLAESELWTQFYSLWPKVLGGLCQAAALALCNRDRTRLPGLPRMADFALWATAAEPALGCGAGEFMRAYTGNRQMVVEATIDGDIVARAIKEWIADEWTGTWTELLALLEGAVDERTKKSHSWPGNARALSGRVKRQAPFLRAAGVDVVRHPRGRRVTFRRVGEFCGTPGTADSDSETG